MIPRAENEGVRGHGAFKLVSSLKIAINLKYSQIVMKYNEIVFQIELIFHYITVFSFYRIFGKCSLGEPKRLLQKHVKSY